MKFKNVRFIFVLFVLLIAIFAIVQVNSKNKKKTEKENVDVSSEVSYQDNIKLGISNVDTVNPITNRNKQLMDIYQLVYEPLLTLDAEYKLDLCLATEYAKTSATTYIVKVNNKIKWSDGSSFSAEDVVYTVGLLKSVDNIYSENVKNIENVEALDNSTLKFNLSEETYFFEYNLIFPIMSKDYYGTEDFFSSSKQPIGTGLYEISSISSDQIILKKNENYRDEEKQNKNINTIYVSIFSEMGEVYNSFKIGNIDIMTTSSTLYEDYIGTMGYYTKEYKGREYDFLSLNCNDYLLKEKSVRQAIGLAIDKDNIISTIYNNKFYTAQYPLDYGSYVYFQNNVSSGYNPEKAKEILSNNGWEYNNNRWRKNGNILTLTISVNASNVQRCAVAKNIKEQLENIGIQVNVWEVSDSQYEYYLNNKNYQILFTGVYNSFSPELTYFYGENNIANYYNEEVIRLINDLKNITDQKNFVEKYKTLIDITKDDCVYIGICRNKNFLLINQNLAGNFEPNNYGVYRIFESWNKKK